MKKLLLIVCFLATAAFSQSRQRIDSINSISFDTKTKNAATLDNLFHKNAANAIKINYPLGEAMSYSNLGLVYYYQGRYNLNVTYVLKAVKLFESLRAYDKLAYEYGSFGYMMKRRNMPRAQYYMVKGKAIAEKNHDTVSLLSIYNNYGVLKEMQHELDSALYFYKKGLVIKEKVQDSIGIPFSLNNIAGIYVMMKRYDEAEKLYEKALATRISLKDEIGIAENFSYFGDLYSAEGNYRKALGYYEKSLEKALQYKYLDLARGNYKSISESHELLGNPKAALENYKLYTAFKDSLLNRETNSKIAELEVRFETNKKEKQLAENRNLLLQNQAEARQKNNLLLVLSLLVFFLALIGGLIYRQQKMKNRQQEQEHELKTAISHIETQNKLQEQRLRISRDLHDNIGAQLTFIISSVDNIKYAFDLKDTRLDTKLQSISMFTKDTILELRDTIWAMNSTEISLENLMARILNFIEKAKNAKETIDFHCTLDESLKNVRLTSVVGMNSYRTIQEAVHNAIKYSHAQTVEIHIRKNENQMKITISDNGIGFDLETIEKGNGLGNMEKRITDIGGKFTLESQVSKGTTVSISLDVTPMRI